LDGQNNSATAGAASTDTVNAGQSPEPPQNPILNDSPPPAIEDVGARVSEKSSPSPLKVLSNAESAYTPEDAISTRATPAAAIGLPQIALDAPPFSPAARTVERQPEGPIVIQGQRDRPALEPRVALVDALHCVISNRSTEALELLQQYNQSTQEICLRLFPILALASQKPMEQWSPSEVANLNEQLQSLSDSLRPRSQLVIGKACFCKSVKSYGIYEPLPEAHAFQASTPTRYGEAVQLYVPLRNFASEKSKEGTETIYTTRLTSVVELRDHKDERVWQQRFPNEGPIRSRSLLSDLYNNYCFNVPNDLPAGSYTLIIRVTDNTLASQPPRTAEARLTFRVTAMPGN
jgi:hypothetical protein